MGHIILVAEEVVKFLARCPPELYTVIKDSFVMSEWEAFVEGSLRETKARDARPLAGGKPMPPAGSAEVKTTISEDSSDEEEEAKFGEPLTRTVAADGFAPRPGFDEGEVSRRVKMLLMCRAGEEQLGLWTRRMRMMMMRIGCDRVRMGEERATMTSGLVLLSRCEYC